MKLFTCDRCQQTLYFENSRCVNCGATLGYCPDLARLVALDAAEVVATDSAAAGAAGMHAVESATVFEIAAPRGQSAERAPRRYRQCRNTRERDACNWLVIEDEGGEYCRSCALSELIPDLSDAANDAAWRRIEAAKRRLLYTLYGLRLPVRSRHDDPERGLAFRFLKGTEDAPVMTGHDQGVITLNVDEADVAFRENMREKMGEGYRTVLGHLRHEIGHYYWDLLIAESNLLDDFRALFGDERASYEDALERHYGNGAPPDWREHFISAYASMHPWEDWAETWAHYLHMLDTLETAKSHGLTVRVPVTEKSGERVVTERLAFADFDALISGWNAVTLALNSLSRSMGHEDAYPFVLTTPVLEKLRFVHRLVQAPVLNEVHAAA